MIEYIKKLFTTPELKLSVLDQLAIVGICVFAVLLFLLFIYILYIIYKKITNAIRIHKIKKWYKQKGLEQPAYFITKRGTGREQDEQHGKRN